MARETLASLRAELEQARREIAALKSAVPPSEDDLDQAHLRLHRALDLPEGKIELGELVDKAVDAIEELTEIRKICDDSLSSLLHVNPHVARFAEDHRPKTLPAAVTRAVEFYAALADYADAESPLKVDQFALFDPDALEPEEAADLLELRRIVARALIRAGEVPPCHPEHVPIGDVCLAARALMFR